MSTAAGLGALGEGFIRGMKLGSDMNDAETRRGLVGLQMKREQAELQKQEQLSQVNKAIADEVMNFKPAGPDDVDGFNGHYDRLTPLIMQQAALTGQNPALVRKSINDLRRGEYAERLYDAVGAIQAGDASGFERLKPVYNQMFKDKGTLLSGAYDQKTDSILLNYKDVEGKDQSMNVPRETFVRQALGYANFRDAVAFDVKDAAERKAAERKETFTATENEKERGLKKELNESDNKEAMRRTVTSGEYSVRAAGASASVRQDSSDAARYEKNRDDFVNALPKAFGYDSNDKFNQQDKPAKDGKPAVEGALTKFNRDAAEATTIWDATAKSGVNLTPHQAKQILEATRAGAVQIKDRKGGYAVVQAGAVTAVVPEQYLKAK